MVDVQRTFTVDKPMAAVVEYLKDFGNAEQWDPGTKTCVRQGSGPVVVGSTWLNTSVFRGRETQLTYELVRLDPDHLTFLGKNKTATSTDDITLREDAGRTTITYHATIVFHGIAKLADPFLRKEFERLADLTERQMTQRIAAL